MKRKIVKHGSSTLTVSLPSKWAKKYKLKAGDEIDLVEEEDCLSICGKGEAEKLEKSASLEFKEKTLPVHIRSVLGAYYRRGYDIIKIKYSDSATFKLIEDSVDSLLGYEIIEHEEGQLLIKNMIIELGDEFKPTLRKMISVIKTISNILFEDIKKDKFDRLGEISNLRHTNWKFRDYCLRIIQKNDLFGEKNFSYSTIIWTLEKISSNYRIIYEYCYKKKSLKRKIPKEIQIFFNEITNYFDLFSKNIYNKNIEIIENIYKKKKNLLLKSEEIISKDKFDNVIMAFLTEIFKRVQDLNSHVVAINI